MPSVVIAGVDSSDKIIDFAKKELVSRVLFLTDAGVYKSGNIKRLVDIQKSEKIDVMLIADVPPEPDKSQVEETFNRVKGFMPQMIIAIGGGSVMDTAKLISAMLSNPGYEKDITDTSLIVNPAITTVMVPTSAGTGSEATQNAIILLREKNIKIGIVHSGFIPKYAVLDPKLTMTLPKSITAATGIDALCHAIECLISKKSNPFCSLFSLKAIELIFNNLVTVYKDGLNIQARENMLLAAFYGGVCINTSSTTAVHALAYPLGGKYHIPHGVSNAMLLSHVLEFSSDAIEDQFSLIADVIGYTKGGKIKKSKTSFVLDAVRKLVEDVEIPTNLEKYGVSFSDIMLLTESAAGVTRLLDQHPKPMGINDIKQIYTKLFPNR